MSDSGLIRTNSNFFPVSNYYELNMITTKIFRLVVNLLGLDYSFIFAPVAIMIVYQCTNLGFEFYLIFYDKIVRIGAYKKDVFSLLYIFQVEVLYVLQIVFIVRALCLRKLQGKIFQAVKPVSNEFSPSEHRRFLRNVLIILTVRFLKMSSQNGSKSLIFLTKTLFSELVFASSDFMFEFYMLNLVRHLKEIKLKMENMKQDEDIEQFKKQLLENFWIKRNIQKRYSMELLSTVIYNFFHLIISLYWVFMRAKFNRLKTFGGKN